MRKLNYLFIALIGLTLFACNPVVEKGNLSIEYPDKSREEFITELANNLVASQIIPPVGETKIIYTGEFYKVQVSHELNDNELEMLRLLAMAMNNAINKYQKTLPWNKDKEINADIKLYPVFNGMSNALIKGSEVIRIDPVNPDKYIRN